MPKAGSLSARGVSGEAAKDSHVPHYNIFGQQHHRVPFKDKGHFERTIQERPEWTREPRHRTRTELFTARRAAKHADLSYDIDGDGAVGPTDYFIGKQFSREQDHRLNTGERAQAVRALEEGFLDNYSFGHEQAGAKRPFPVHQARGKIIMVDNAHELNEVYPPHWNAHKNPPFKTATDLAHHRKAELTNAADKLKSDWDEKNPVWIPEPPVPRDPTPQVFGKTNRVRRDARQREARTKAGMDELNSYVNPHREEQEPGLDHRHQPPHATRTALREARKVQLAEDLQNTRLAGETDYVPKVARHTWQDDFDYEQRRPDPEALTMTKLRQMRKEENVEYNMRNFRLQDVEHPRFSDQEEPWWKRQNGYVHEPPSCLLKELKDPSKEVTGRVVDHVPTRPRARGDTASEGSVVSKGSAATIDCPHDNMGDRTIKRWTTEFVPQSLADKLPRYFDGVKQAPTYSTDTAQIDVFSSFESISKGAIQKDAERQKRTAREDEERAHSWKLHMRGLPDPNTGSPGVDRALPQPGSIRSASSRAASDPAGPPHPRMTEVLRGHLSSTPLPGPMGEDLPMQERLERLADKTLAGSRIAPAASSMKSPMAPISEIGLETPRSNSPVARAGDSPKRGAVQRPSVSSKLPESGRGSRLDKVVAADAPTAERRMVVRASGFQWVNKHAPPILAEDASASSLPAATMVPRSMSKHSLLQETPPRSRSVSRTHQNSAAAVG
mmetsp:Transcript_44353/g.77914  ORF Transcript_44353/g.77914 Transcript_44353/m.77914 type:complete len:726 (+) Transcript_44353:103-2280(+)